MAIEPELIEQIAADPDDDAPQLVIADHLIAQGDTRGDLIVLDHRERTTFGGLEDPDAIEQLLLLAAEYTFPCARAPDESILPFERDADAPVHYHVEFVGPVTLGARQRFDVRYTDGALYIAREGRQVVAFDDVAYATRDTWTEGETALTLRAISDALRAGTPLEHLRFAAMSQPPPTYAGGALRVYRLPMDFRAPRGLAPDRYGLAARDYSRWHRIWRRLRDRR